jgi:hypothetical protein
MLISLMVSYLILCVMGGLICYERDSIEGITWTVAFVYVFTTLGALTRPFECDNGLKPYEIIGFVGSIILHLVWSLIDFGVRFDFEADTDNHGNLYVIWYFLGLPFVVVFLTCLYKWYDKKWKMDQFVKITLGVLLLFGFCEIVLCFILIGPITGVLFSIIVAVIIYVTLAIYVYYKKGGYLPFGWVIANMVALSLAAFSIFIIALSWNDFNTFVGWSISYGIIVLMIFLYGAVQLGRDIMKAEIEPIYFSPWVFPIFKYTIKKNDIELRNGPVALILLCILLTLCWSFQLSVWVDSVTAGIAVSCLCEVILIIFVFYLSSFTAVMLGNVKLNLDQILIKRSWLEAKNDYVQAKSIDTPESMVTYVEIANRRDTIVTHLDQVKKDSNFAKKDTVYAWNTKGINATSITSLRKCLFDIEIEKTHIYHDEISLIVQFELLMILYSNARIIKDQKVLTRFLIIKKHALAAADINIDIPLKGKANYKYAKVLTQIGQLPAEKQVLFKNLRKDFEEEEYQKEEDLLEQERIEFAKEQERQERMSKMSEAKKKLLLDFDENMPIDDMPDCEPKYKKIIENFRRDKVLFEDKQFPPTEASLGPGCTNRGVAKWVRASEVPGTVIYRDKVDPRDVVQGALGDCYFLSAMSVLGEDNVKKIIQFVKEGDPEEAKSGAYLVRFHKYSNIEDVVIDDYFPVLGNGKFAFAKGGQDGLELWPMIIEKAYAKLNGSYNNIEAGKVQYALADMTGGVSEQIELRSVDNKNSFWERIKSLVAQGALMGAGSPENALGDSAINEFGIVQGHAYAVLQFCEFDNYKLISLRNPHGNEGIEWNGDWSDDSGMWTQRAKSKCMFSDAHDGIFWMDLDDFLENFSYLYVCRIMKHWHQEEIKDEWKGETAEGLPTAANRTAKLEKNPQFVINITKPAPLFIQMTQFEKINMFKGKQFIIFVLQTINGKRITRMDKSSILGMSGKPVNLNIVSSEITLTTEHSYPLTVTIVAANTNHGKEGEGKFMLNVFSMSSIKMKKI